MTADIEKMQEAFRRRGLKLTAQRKKIAEKLLSIKGHHSAEEISDLLKQDGTTVSKATVYRTLALLEECGIFDSHDFGNGRKVYEKAIGRAHHDHLFCIGCGAVFEFQEPKIEALQDRVVEKYNFTAVYHSHKIFGYCSRCSRKGKLRR